MLGVVLESKLCWNLTHSRKVSGSSKCTAFLQGSASKAPPQPDVCRGFWGPSPRRWMTDKIVPIKGLWILAERCEQCSNLPDPVKCSPELKRQWLKIESGYYCSERRPFPKVGFVESSFKLESRLR
jgi:hypothetical protein